MNYAAGLIAPLFGAVASLYCGTLLIASFWNAVLLLAIGFQHNWARFALAAFLLGFDAVTLLLIPEIMIRHRLLKDEGIQVITLLCSTNALAAAFLLYSIDIRWIARPNDAGNA